jgi:hypothetical protein
MDDVGFGYLADSGEDKLQRKGLGSARAQDGTMEGQKPTSFCLASRS